MTPQELTELVTDAVGRLNLSRAPEAQLSTSPEAPLFGKGSPLDSLGLVSLLIDIEEALQDRGLVITLSDERAMSQSRSPFRSIQTLVSYVTELLTAKP